MNVNLNQYEAAVTALALRQFSVAQLQAAVAAYQANNISDGKDAQEQAETATRIADQLQQS